MLAATAISDQYPCPIFFPPVIILRELLTRDLLPIAKFLVRK